MGAIVIAESEALCEKALDALKIEWEQLPFIVDLEKGLDLDFPAIRGRNGMSPIHMGHPLPLRRDIRGWQFTILRTRRKR